MIEVIISAITSAISLIIAILKLRSSIVDRRKKEKMKWSDQMNLNEKMMQIITHNNEIIELLKEKQQNIQELVFLAIDQLQELSEKIENDK